VSFKACGAFGFVLTNASTVIICGLSLKGFLGSRILSLSISSQENMIIENNKKYLI
jgi:alpha-tubulin suppressor-like RCC1 family protein